MIKWDSVPGNILRHAFEGNVIPVLNEEIIREYRAVLTRPKFHLTDDIVNSVLDRVEEKGIYVDAESLEIELPDPKDLAFYEVVMESRKTSKKYVVKATPSPDAPSVASAISLRQDGC